MHKHYCYLICIHPKFNLLHNIQQQNVCDSWSECLDSLMVGAVRTSCSGWTLQVLSVEDSVCFSTGPDALTGGPFTGRTSRETLLNWRSEVPRPLKKNMILLLLKKGTFHPHTQTLKCLLPHTRVHKHPKLALITVIYRWHMSIPWQSLVIRKPLHYNATSFHWSCHHLPLLWQWKLSPTIQVNQ